MYDNKPFVPLEVVFYLQKVYSLPDLLNKEFNNADRKLGYMEGINEVITILDALARRKDGKHE
jgi:hypothetical protein